MAVTITKPASGATLTGLATVEATYSGQNFDTATVTIDGQQLASDSAKPIAFSIDTARVPDGSHTLTVAVRYRTNGGVLRWQKASIPITTEGNDMEVVLSTNKDTSNLNGTVVVTATVTPAGHANPLTNGKFYVGSGTPVVWVLKATDTSYPLSFSWDTTTVVDGDYSLRATVIAKQTKTSSPLPVKVKNGSPQPPPPDPPVVQTAPVITGTATEGLVLTLNRGIWSNNPTSYTQAWLRCSAAGVVEGAIPGATGTSYALETEDVGKTIRCKVIAYNMGATGSQASAPYTTAQTGVVAAAPGATPTADFTWSPFSPEVGETVTFTAVTDGVLCHWDRTRDQVAEASLEPDDPFTYAYTSEGSKTMQLQTESAGGILSNWISEDLIVSDATPDPPPPPPPSGTTFVYHNPETLTLQPWMRIQTGTVTNNTVNYYVSNVPTGITTPSVVGIVTDPLAERGKVYELTTTTDSNYVGSSGSAFERCDLWQHNGVAWNVQGSEIWENFKIMFPNSFTPGTGGYYVWVYQHHCGAVNNLPDTGIILGVRAVAASYFHFKVPGGNVNSYPGTSIFNGPVIQRNHWYTIETHIKWSTGSDGFANLYIDGALVYQTGSRPTLGYNGSTVDNPGYQFSNYHAAVNATSRIYYDGPKIGTTRGAAYFA